MEVENIGEMYMDKGLEGKWNWVKECDEKCSRKF